MEDVVGFEALYESAMKCKKGVIWKDSVAHYILNIVEETIKLREALESGEYRSRPLKSFSVSNNGKQRIVMGVGFRDRVYQRSLNDNAIYPAMTKSFIYDNAACQKGRGTNFARGRLTCFLQRFYRRNKRNGFVLKCDISGYYPNMRHDVAEATFKEKLPPDVFEAAVKVLREQYPGEVGYLPGSQMVQIAGISVLNHFDHFVKEVLRVKYYLRYMDDFILIDESKERLEDYRCRIAAELAKIGFELNPKKTQIISISSKIKFLGFEFYLTETGKVIKTLPSKNVKQQRKKLRRLVALSKKGKIPRSKVDECYRSWRAHAAGGNTHNLLKRMDAYYKNLWCSDML